MAVSPHTTLQSPSCALCALPPIDLGLSGHLLRDTFSRDCLVNLDLGLVRVFPFSWKPEVCGNSVQGFLNLSITIQKMEIMLIIILFSLGAPRIIPHFNGESTQ